MQGRGAEHPETATIPRKVRREIFEMLQLDSKHWAGELDQADFLGRLFDLDALPSTDPRYGTAARDIWQHTSNNDDWSFDWVLTDSRFNLGSCPDALFLDFLAETLHPLVRPDRDEASHLLGLYREVLRPFGWTLEEGSSIVGRPRYVPRRLGAARSSAADRTKQLAEAMDAGWMHREVLRIERAVEEDPDLAIGTAKDLIETCCKTVLREVGEVVNPRAEFPELTKAALKALKLSREDIKGDGTGVELARTLLSNLASVTRYMNELRNLYGTGHGRDGRHRGLGPRHARLAATAAVAFANFLIETHHEQRDRSKAAAKG